MYTSKYSDTRTVCPLLLLGSGTGDGESETTSTNIICRNFAVLATQRAWAEVTYRQTTVTLRACAPRVNEYITTL